MGADWLVEAGWLVGLVALAVGGALGAVARLRLTRRLPARGVLVANTTASLVAGFTLGLAVPTLLFARGLLFGWPGVLVLGGMSLVGGFCLALGTWSTVAVQTADAVVDARWGEAVRLWGAHLGLGLAAVVVGWGLGAGAHLLLA